MALKKLILIMDQKPIQIDNIEELIQILLGDNYYNLSKENQIQLMELNAKTLTFNSEYEVVNLLKSNISNFEFNNKFIIYDEFTYILSLLILEKCLLLESKESNIFTINIEKKEIMENYIIVNTFAKEILKQYVKINVNRS